MYTVHQLADSHLINSFEDLFLIDLEFLKQSGEPLLKITRRAHLHGTPTVRIEITDTFSLQLTEFKSLANAKPSVHARVHARPTPPPNCR